MTTFNDLILKFRKYKNIETLDAVVERIKDRSPEDATLIDSAADHRRAELTAETLFNPGRVPVAAWRLSE